MDRPITPIPSLEFLEDVNRSFLEKSVTQGMELLRDRLDTLRSNSDTNEWRGICTATQTHPINKYTLKDPYTERAREKPRGYAGDAPMLDYVYGNGEHSGNLPIDSSVGVEINSFTTRQPPALAVMHRRDLLSQEIVKSHKDHEDTNILAVACGHLRELDGINEALGDVTYKTSSMIALDQDEESIGVVKKIESPIAITTHVAGLKEYVNNQIEASQLSLAYAAGIFDYLPKPIAQKLAAKMLSDLRPGGRAIISNFLVNTKGSGYMEAVMDWFLIYRTQSQIIELIDGLRNGDELISDISYTTDPNGCIGYLSITKK